MIPCRQILLCTVAILAGCGNFPEVDAATSPAALNAPFPDLVPAESLRASVPDTVIEDNTADTLEARAERLRARAARLRRGDVIDNPSKARLDKDISVDEG